MTYASAGASSAGASAAAASAASAPAPAPAPASGLLPAHVIREGGYTNVRQDPSTSAIIVNKIADGSPIKYKKYNAKWCIVYDLAGNRLGYMHASKVIPD